MTGGDAQLLSTQLKSRFFATPFLMLEGIYYLYQFNKDL
ncbi:pantothenate kinase type III, CoaX-like [Nonlabens ulvanivorans]|nr:pantothenate kinase type III, CoaX-like [Nonlabens ulvanivorans]